MSSGKVYVGGLDRKSNETWLQVPSGCGSSNGAQHSLLKH
jgi:hypothetical protein